MPRHLCISALVDGEDTRHSCLPLGARSYVLLATRIDAEVVLVLSILLLHISACSEHEFIKALHVLGEG